MSDKPTGRHRGGFDATMAEYGYTEIYRIIYAAVLAALQ
jgi:hypothetical protein